MVEQAHVVFEIFCGAKSFILSLAAEHKVCHNWVSRISNRALAQAVLEMSWDCRDFSQKTLVASLLLVAMASSLLAMAST